MTVKIEILDPQQENPNTLRTIAHFLNCLAADREGNHQQYAATLQPGVTVKSTTLQVGDRSKTETVITQDTLPANPGNGQDASGASAVLTSQQGANAQGDAGTTGTTVLDKNGLPWDQRIHSSSKNLNADGTWRYLRVTKAEDKDAFEALKLQVEAELRGAAPADQTPPPPPPVPDANAQTPPPPPPVAQTEQAPPPPPPVNQASTDTGAAADAAVDFKQVFSRVTALQKHASGNLLPPELLTQVLELAEVAPPTMAGFMKPENKVRAPAVLDAINALVQEPQ